jgi:hypothetical protein
VVLVVVVGAEVVVAVVAMVVAVSPATVVSETTVTGVHAAAMRARATVGATRRIMVGQVIGSPRL